MSRFRVLDRTGTDELALYFDWLVRFQRRRGRAPLSTPPPGSVSDVGDAGAAGVGLPAGQDDSSVFDLFRTSDAIAQAIYDFDDGQH